MNNDKYLQKLLSLLGLMVLTTVLLARQDEKPQLKENEVVLNIAFEVTEQFSGLIESASTKKQLLVQLDEWQVLGLDRYIIKFKTSEHLSDDNEPLFMIETQILDSYENKIHAPSLMTAANSMATIVISAETSVEPSFNLSFMVASK
ncbi:MAG: hypothetical protein DWP95_01420 [Proteobacteria bacterium]|nr:MAG: hypothetical protein DWP95_01420 [Pseudomonadota bacterium]